MTNTLAIILGGLAVSLIALDLLFNGGVGLLFLSKKFVDMTTWMAFWH